MKGAIPKNIQCAVYARYSSDLQSDNSIDDQIRNCRRGAKDRDWSILDGHIYVDRAVSGTTIAGRTGLPRLMDAVNQRKRPFDYILIDDTSRLSRDKIEQSTLIRDFKDEGVNIFFVSDNIDTADETTEDILLPIYGIKDSLYSRELARKTQRGMAGQVLKGYNAGGRLYGYKYSLISDPSGVIDRKTRQVRSLGTKIEIDSQQAQVVRQIFSMYASGYGLKAIAMSLNEKEITPPRRDVQFRRGNINPTWGPHTVRAMLHNSKYSGDWTWNRKQWYRKRKSGKRVYRDRPIEDWVKYDCPELAIVDVTTFDEVRLKIERNRELYVKGERTPKRNYLLSGLMKCELCNSNLIVVRIRNASEADYGCSFNWHRGSKACPNNIRIKRSEIEERVFAAIRKKVLHPNSINRIVEMVNNRLKSISEHSSHDLDSLVTRASAIESEIRNLIRFIAETGDTSPHVTEAISQKGSVLAEVRSRINCLQEPSESKPLCVDTGVVVKWIQKLGELASTDVLAARSGIEKIVGVLKAKPVTQNGATGLLLTGKPQLMGILGLIGGGSTLIGSGGRI